MCEVWEAFPLEIGLVPDEQTILFSLRYHILSTHNIGNCISNNCVLTNCTNLDSVFAVSKKLGLLSWSGKSSVCKLRSAGTLCAQRWYCWHWFFFVFPMGAKYQTDQPPLSCRNPEQSVTACLQAAKKKHPGLGVSWGFTLKKPKPI